MTANFDWGVAFIYLWSQGQLVQESQSGQSALQKPHALRTSAWCVVLRYQAEYMLGIESLPRKVIVTVNNHACTIKMWVGRRL
ncbi:hypothetical protein EJ06DRAFT_271283 [Trichodelitschia bisporula]|uniref:Uncharacterized protein n=1 Tax=Trichodelitschia bisporula TaxID=703511 RepID=A0A6G1I5H0_9PEZI|nr:hypothetical protein EJ06DRAFT_271283 [Trichodelitschia bisporula]